MWKAATSLPLTTHTGPAAFKTRLLQRSAGMGAVDLQEGTSFTGLHRASVLPSLSGRAVGGDWWNGALEAPGDRRQTGGGRGRTRCTVEVALNLTIPADPLFFSDKGL